MSAKKSTLKQTPDLSVAEFERLSRAFANLEAEFAGFCDTSSQVIGLQRDTINEMQAVVSASDDLVRSLEAQIASADRSIAASDRIIQAQAELIETCEEVLRDYDPKAMDIEDVPPPISTRWRAWRPSSSISSPLQDEVMISRKIIDEMIALRPLAVIVPAEETSLTEANEDHSR
jgi:hypothetical protein